MLMDDVLKQMVVIYKPDGVDWLNFKLCRKNPYTFHHIEKRCDGGLRIISNGAILTRLGHDFLNILEIREPELYRNLNLLFKELNNTKLPPTEDYYEEVNGILRQKPKVLTLTRARRQY